MSKKMKLYQEEAKTRHTSHWDWDYMTTAEFDALMREQQQQRERTATQAARRQWLVRASAGGAIIVLISIISFMQF